ncbi:hypothetical protein ACFLWR_03820 [Chloroflexota bacterium]
MCKAALFELIGWVLFPMGIGIILFAWLGWSGLWVIAGVEILNFLNGNLVWAIIQTVVGGFFASLGVVMSRS